MVVSGCCCGVPCWGMFPQQFHSLWNVEECNQDKPWIVVLGSNVLPEVYIFQSDLWSQPSVFPL